MIELIERVHIAGDYACPDCASECSIDPAGRALLTERGGDWAVIHACKSPCHQRAVGYRGNLDKSHPNYLTLERGNGLYLNMIDPPVPLFPPLLFAAALRFADDHWNAGRAVLFHCNQGRSRAPSLALFYLSKVRRVLTNHSYAYARAEFEALYELYAPGKGIETYLTAHWAEISL